MSDRLIALIIGTDKTPEEFKRLLTAPDLLAIQLGRENDEPAPALPPAPKRLGKPTCSNQAVINILLKAAQRVGYGADWWMLMVARVGLHIHVVNNRAAVYSGPPLDELDWTPKERAALEDFIDLIAVE